MNKVHKGDSAISDRTRNPQVLLKYCLSSTEVTRPAERMVNVCVWTTNASSAFCIREFPSEETVKEFRAVVERLKPFSISENGDGSDLKLVNLITKQVVPTGYKMAWMWRHMAESFHEFKVGLVYVMIMLTSLSNILYGWCQLFVQYRIVFEECFDPYIRDIWWASNAVL